MREYDVVVCGGGFAGAAAISAAGFCGDIRKIDVAVLLEKLKENGMFF